MGSNPPNSGSTPPPKPWERAGTSSGPAPFKPPSSGNTSEVVEASGTAKPGEVVSTVNTAANQNTLTRPVPQRPWQQNYGNSIGGYGSNMNYNSGYGTGMYSSYGGFGGSSYGGGLYGNNSMYGGGYGGGLYGGSGMYEGGMYNSGFRGPMGGYGMGMGGPYGNQDPNNPFGAPPSPPGFWMSFLQVNAHEEQEKILEDCHIASYALSKLRNMSERYERLNDNVMHGVVNFFGRISVLIDQNTHAFHMFMSALLQLFDRSGMLYGELARFVLRILGIRTKSRKQQQLGPGELPGPDGQGQRYIEGPKAATGAWDNVWGAEGANTAS